MKNTFLQEMQERGYLNQCTNLDKLSEISEKKTISGYIGFDCTAPSLHVGSLLQIMILKLMQKYGHRPIVLLGGGTTLIGDPSGKDSTRKILKQGEIKKNIDVAATFTNMNMLLLTTLATAQIQTSISEALNITSETWLKRRIFSIFLMYRSTLFP